jgi:hypothetical protein
MMENEHNFYNPSIKEGHLFVCHAEIFQIKSLPL